MTDEFGLLQQRTACQERSAGTPKRIGLAALILTCATAIGCEGARPYITVAEAPAACVGDVASVTLGIYNLTGEFEVVVGADEQRGAILNRPSEVSPIAGSEVLEGDRQVEVSLVEAELSVNFLCLAPGTWTRSISLSRINDPDPDYPHQYENPVSVTIQCDPCLTPDLRDDYIDSVSSNTATYTSESIDQVGGQWRFVRVPLESQNLRFRGTAYDCGARFDDGSFVVCPADAQAMPEGDVVIAYAEHAADIPVADPGHSFIYSLVVDSDGDAANNWQYVPPYDWDLFRDTDRWYQLVWNHQAEQWSVTVTQVDSNQQTTQVPSTARALVDGPTVLWFVSASEFASETPGYRLTSFGHDGSFSVSDRGADVSGANPTEPLWMPQ